MKYIFSKITKPHLDLYIAFIQRIRISKYGSIHRNNINNICWICCCCYNNSFFAHWVPFQCETLIHCQEVKNPHSVQQWHKWGSSTVETAYSDHGYSNQPFIWIKRLGTESILFKCSLNNLFIAIKKSARNSVLCWSFYEWNHTKTNLKLCVFILFLTPMIPCRTSAPAGLHLAYS